MSKLTKNQKVALEKLEPGKAYTLAEAAEKVKEISYTKFDASLDIDVRLGVDPRKANQMVRGDVNLSSRYSNAPGRRHQHQTRREFVARSPRYAPASLVHFAV